MALKVKICVLLSSDCKTAYFFDVTGLYHVTTNPTGYGAPNAAVADFLTATLKVKFAGSTTFETPINIWGSPAFPSSSPTNVWVVNASDYGMTTFPQGINRFTYDITGVSIAEHDTALAASLCTLECCVKKKVADLAKNPSSCNCNDKRIADKDYMKSLLEGIKWNTCCGDEVNANKGIEILTTLCGGCGCSGH